MKALSIKYCIGLLALGLIFTACKKSGHTFESKGVITLNILYTCASCPGGGYYIQFANDTTKLYHIDNDLTPFGVTAGLKFPLNVSVNWKTDSNAPQAANVRPGDNVIITALKID